MENITTQTNIDLLANREMISKNFIESIDNRPTTKTAYQKGIKKFMLFLESNNITTPTKKTIIDYKNYLLNNFEAPSVNLYLTSIKTFYNFLSKNYGMQNLTDGLKNVRIEKGYKKDSLTDKQVKELLTLNMTLRDKAIILLMLTGALRSCEVERANINDLTANNKGYILKVQGKGEETKNNYIIITETTYKAINEYLKTRKNKKSNDPLFTSESNHNHNGRITTRSIRRLAKKYFSLIGIDTPKITAHSLRHTAINMAIDGGANLLEAQQLARHKSPITTQQNYIDFRTNQIAKIKTADILESKIKTA